jgi:hypothetical protein
VTLLKSLRPGFPTVLTKPGTPKSPPGVPTAPVTPQISTPSGLSIGVATASTTPESAKPSADSYPSTKFNERVHQRSGEFDVSREPPAAKRVLPLLRVDRHGAGNSSDVKGEGRSPHADVKTKGSREGDVADKQAEGIRKGEVSVEQAEGTRKGDSDKQAEGTREGDDDDITARVAERKLRLAADVQEAQDRLADAEKEVEEARKHLEKAKAEEAKFCRAILKLI